jgi:hypothetical protein
MLIKMYINTDKTKNKVKYMDVSTQVKLLNQKRMTRSRMVPVRSELIVMTIWTYATQRNQLTQMIAQSRRPTGNSIIRKATIRSIMVLRRINQKKCSMKQQLRDLRSTSILKKKGSHL